jgi:cell fate (sporulation/competence/biofilm development) regulator YlbF (YheA/YmcA/DUF963 family)
MNPLELAEQLGEAILASQEYRELEQAREAMENDEEARKLVEMFQDRQQALRDAQMMGRKISREQIDELRAHQRKMLENKEIDTYLEAKKKVDQLLSAVNETIARVTGMETGRGQGGCGGGCC